MDSIDALVSPTLKHLREHWWDDEFTEFLVETLRPRPGNRILDVGCGAGAAEVSIGRLHVSQLRLYGVDLRLSEAIAAASETASHNIHARFAAGDARRLPFADGSFDSTFCVAVLQHVGEVEIAVRELGRVTHADGRIVAVEPDNAARYAYSSTPSGARAFQLAAEFFAAVAAARGDVADPAVGPRLPALFAANGIEPVMVRLFPVSHPRLGAPPDKVWQARRGAIEQALSGADERVTALGQDYTRALADYEREARAANGVFVEIQNTMLFATVGQKAS
jgi:ubiquinone/menaquinone biosynthesis C-methylase UbiE